jgi:hypothetical protein
MVVPEVGVNYFCHEKYIDIIKGAPQQWKFRLLSKSTTSLKGGPVKVEGIMMHILISHYFLDGSPWTVGSFFVSQNEFTNFDWHPRFICLYHSRQILPVYGDRNCEVNKVIIFEYQQVPRIKDNFVQTVIDNQCCLPIIFWHNQH